MNEAIQFYSAYSQLCNRVFWQNCLLWKRDWFRVENLVNHHTGLH